jgi:hypothetical protein
LFHSITPSYAQVCDSLSGWIQEGGKCYLFQQGFKLNWTDCKEHWYNQPYPGAKMLCVLTKTENDWMYRKYLGIKGEERYGGWIGYSSTNVTSWYGWVEGCSSNYTNWDVPLEPNNAGNNEHYATMKTMHIFIRLACFLVLLIELQVIKQLLLKKATVGLTRHFNFADVT